MRQVRFSVAAFDSAASVGFCLRLVDAPASSVTPRGGV